MGKETGISWTDHTFNHVRGCTKISDGCAHCYAAELSKINPKVLGSWGPNGTRVVAAESYWRQPLAWDKAARKAGVRRRVFCASLADVFEKWEGGMSDVQGRPMLLLPTGEWAPQTADWQPPGSRPLRMREARDRLFGLVAATKNLDWLILTKRPERMARYFQRKNHWGAAEAFRDLHYGRESGVSLGDGLADWPPDNVWAGASVENQATADERIPHLYQIPAAVRFLSMEPLLGPVELANVSGWGKHTAKFWGTSISDYLHWVIVGGESGDHARPFDLAWARSVRDRCKAAGVACFVKQVGSRPFDSFDRSRATDQRLYLKAGHGDDPSEWPSDLQVQDFPDANS
jgi:protein gp37